MGINFFNKEANYPWFKFYGDVKKHINYPDVSMYELVRRSAEKYSSSIAYSFYGNRITYRSFIRKVDECACAFARMGVVSKDVVTIIMPNIPEAIICFYALNKIGAVCNMLHPLASEEELKYGIELVDSSYLVVADVVYGKIKNIKKDLKIKKILYIPVGEGMDPISKLGYFLTEGRKVEKPYGDDVIPYFRFIARAKFHKTRIKDEGRGADTAVILHSGGTTGKPKGIVLTNMNFNSLAISEREINITLKNGVTMLAIMPIFHGFGLGSTFHAILTSGAEAIILPSVSPKKFDSTILKYRPNIIACVPSLLETITLSKKLQDEDLSFIKCIVVGGDSLSTQLHERINNFMYDHGSDAKARPAFGMTECTAGVTMMPINEARFGSIGVPIPDSYVKIVEPGTKKEVEVGTIGEICISGTTVMKEYYNNKSETKNVLKVHDDKKTWLHSGDLGYMDEDGFVYFTSRLKRMIVSSGYNIYPSQLEEIINAHPYVQTSVVVGVPHPYKKEVAKAYIVLKEGLTLNREIKKSIKEYCEKNIAAYALPYAYGYRKELPKTKIGKIAYKELENGKDLEEEDNDKD